MRRCRPLHTVTALLALAAAAPAMAQDILPGEGREVWPEHAAPDDAVAREGRAAMPFTVQQIEDLGRLLRETQGAASLAADPVPRRDVLFGSRARRDSTWP